MIAIYEDGGRGAGRGSPLRSELLPSFELTDGERSDLVEVLHSLTDDQVLSNPAQGNPW